MISYAPLWEMMEKNGMTAYALRCKGQISSSTIARIKKGESISTNTLDALCKALNCKVCDIIEYIDDDAKEN